MDDLTQIKSDLAEIADLIVMVAANSHTTYFTEIQRRANVVINHYLDVALAERQSRDGAEDGGS